MRPVLILFAKSPEPGRVKTRLAKAIGMKEAAQLHTAFVADCLVRANKLADLGHADVELHTDELTDAWAHFGVTNRLQVAGDLGARMYTAMRNAIDEGRPSAMIVGTDSPTLPAAHIEELLSFDADVALGPSEDGGYYAICCRRVAADMFRAVNWSTASALCDTEVSCTQAGLTVGRGSSWYDVDNFADLNRLIAEGNLPEHTAKILEKLHVG